MSIVTHSHTENITPHKAQTWLDERYGRQRRVSDSRVKFYAKEMKRGKWQPTNPIALAHVDGNTHLVNGQHTLLAVLESGATLKYNPIHIHQVTEMDDIDELYAHYDIGKKRNYADSLRAYRVDEHTDLPLSAIQHLSSGIVSVMSGFPRRNTRYSIAHDELIDLVYEWCDTFKQVRHAVSESESGIVKRILIKSVLSVALVTMRYQPEDAFEFWRQVARIDRLPRNDPRLALHKALISWELKGGDTGAPGEEPGTFSRAAAYAWNKYRRGAGLSVIKSSVVSKMYPIVIDGTPYDGKSNPT